MPKITFKSGRGINRDSLPSELAAGVWSNCQNMRFRNGFDERVGGVAAVFTTPAVAPYWLQTYAVGTTTTLTRNLVYTGLAKAYVDDGTTRTEISRYTDTRITAIASPVGAGTRFTTSTAHGLAEGDNVLISGTTSADGTRAVPIGGIISTTQFDLTGSLGNESGDKVGLCSRLVVEDFTATADTRWTGGVLNGICIANSPNDGLFYWGGTTTIRFRRILAGTTPFTMLAEVARPYKNYIVLLGKRLSGAVKKPYLISWSAAQDPGAVPGITGFTAAATNDAGEVEKAETPGALVDCLPFGDVNIVYKEDARIAMQWIGGVDVFSFRYLPGSEGLLAPGCVVDTPAGHVFLTPSYDVRVHQGGASESIAEGSMWQWIRSNISSTNANAKRSFLSYNPIANEVEIHLVTGANTVCTKVLLWNCADRTWGERDEAAVTCGTYGTLPSAIAAGQRSIVGTTTPTIGLMDSGTSYFSAAYTSMVERTGISTEDPETVKNLQGSRWQDDGTADVTSSVYHGSAMTADGTVTYADAVTATLGTSNWVNKRATGGRYMAVKRTTTGAIGKCRSVDLDFTVSGTR